MPSSYSASIRVTLQATGENNNTWGVILNQQTLMLLDSAIAGVAPIALSGPYALTVANGAPDQARNAILLLTGTGGVATIPATSKRYDVINNCTGVATLSNGSSQVTIQAGECVGVVTDGGANFRRVTPVDFGGQNLINVSSLAGVAGGISGLNPPTTPDQAANKGYVDTAITSGVWEILGGISVKPGDAGKFLTNDGTVPGWAPVVVNPLPALTGVGGLTAAFPALRANGAALDIALGDGSKLTNLNAANVTSNGSPVVTNGLAIALAAAL